MACLHIGRKIFRPYKSTNIVRAGFKPAPTISSLPTFYFPGIPHPTIFTQTTPFVDGTDVPVTETACFMA